MYSSICPSSVLSRAVMAGYPPGRLIAWTEPSTLDTPLVLAQRAGPALPPASARIRPRVEEIAQGVAHQVERQYDHEDGEPGQEDHVRAQDDELPARRQHAAPVGRGRLGAPAQEGQP